MAIFRCEIAGVPTGSLDIQVRYYESKTEKDAIRRLEQEPITEYTNDKGETVSWKLSDVVSAEAIVPYSDSDEIIGFIANVDDFEGYTDPTSKNRE